MSKDIMNEILELAGCEPINEGLRDFLPRAGRVGPEGNKLRHSGFIGQGTDEQMRKAQIIAYVKGMRGQHFGMVSKADLDNFAEYEAEYNQIMDGYNGDVEEEVIDEDNFEEPEEEPVPSDEL